MRKLLIAILAVSSIFVIGCTKVPAGNVGVKVYLLGTEKGVDSEVVGVGRYWIGVNEDLYLFPTFTQNYVWTQDVAEGSPNDESFQFQTMEGMAVGADMGISYSIDPDKVDVVFQKYRKGVEEITDIYLRNMVRDALVTVGSTRPMEDVYGAGKAELIKEVQASVTEQVKDIGIIVEKVYWIGGLRLPKSVNDALNAKMDAIQKTQQRENEVAQTKAEADKAREEAKGLADSVLIKARAEAKAISLRGQALRNNPDLIKLNAIEKWDGVLPLSTGNQSLPFLDIKK